MADTWITDMRHYLSEDGSLADLPDRVLALVFHQGAIVGWVSRLPSVDFQSTNVPCRRRPRRRRCLGEIEAQLLPDSSIEWGCPFCGEGGRISGWEGTLWDKRIPS